MVPGYDPRSGGVVKKAGPIRCGQARCRRPGVICSPKTGPREMRVLQVNRLFLPVRQTPAGTGTPVRCGVFPYYSVFARISPLLSICQGQEPVLFHAFLAKSSVECVDEGPACGLPAPPKSGFTPPMPVDVCEIGQPVSFWLLEQTMGTRPPWRCRCKQPLDSLRGTGLPKGKAPAASAGAFQS